MRLFKTVYIKTHKTAFNRPVDPFIFVAYRNDRFFSHTNPYISNALRMLADAHQFRAWATSVYGSILLE